MSHYQGLRKHQDQFLDFYVNLKFPLVVLDLKSIFGRKTFVKLNFCIQFCLTKFVEPYSIVGGF